MVKCKDGLVRTLREYIAETQQLYGLSTRPQVLHFLRRPKNYFISSNRSVLLADTRFLYTGSPKMPISLEKFLQVRITIDVGNSKKMQKVSGKTYLQRMMEDLNLESEQQTFQKLIELTS